MLINGSYWTGMIGMLLNQTADMAAAPISITQERQEVVTFGTVLFEDSLGLLFSKPQDRQNSGALIAPFSTTVWITVILIALMVCPILSLLVRLSTWVKRQRKRRIKDSNLYMNFGDCIWFVYSGLMKQGCEKSSSSIPVRLLMAAWWLTSLLIAAFYTANLTAFLTTETSISALTIKDLTELGFRWTFKKGTAFSNKLLKEENFKAKDEFFLLRESLRKKLGKSVNSEEDAMEYTQKGYSYIQEVNILNYLLFQDFKARQYCKFHVLDLNLFKHSAAFAFPRGSPYAIHFSHYMEALRKNGLIQKWMQQHLSKTDVCTLHHDNKLSQKEQALTLNDVYTAFYLLLIGIFASSICFITERYYSKHRDKNRKIGLIRNKRK
ncbi:glutamate receptor ionotropic, delta-2 isoform X2 [Parasteatoda tepidariorum]|nr:glutamate receptor ionotropic, delta-2 isoform X2 [Parasteatoda tepidariorum]